MVTTGSVNDTIVACDSIPSVDEVVMANDNCDGMLAVTPGETSNQSNNSASCAFYNYDITRT